VKESLARCNGSVVVWNDWSAEGSDAESRQCKFLNYTGSKSKKLIAVLKIINGY